MKPSGKAVLPARFPAGSSTAPRRAGNSGHCTENPSPPLPDCAVPFRRCRTGRGNAPRDNGKIRRCRMRRTPIRTSAYRPVPQSGSAPPPSPDRSPIPGAGTAPSNRRAHQGAPPRRTAAESNFWSAPGRNRPGRRGCGRRSPPAPSRDSNSAAKTAIRLRRGPARNGRKAPRTAPTTPRSRGSRPAVPPRSRRGRRCRNRRIRARTPRRASTRKGWCPRRSPAHSTASAAAAPPGPRRRC